MLPFFIVLKISFAEADVAIPPYTEIYTYAEQKLQLVLNLATTPARRRRAVHRRLPGLAEDRPLQHPAVPADRLPDGLRHRQASKEQTVLLLLIMMPTWTAILIRVYAWMGILSNNGLLNGFLMWHGLIDEPLQILNTNLAVYIGVVYSYLPFMILPLYANLVKHDQPAGGRLRPGFEHLQQLLEDHRAAVQERHHRRLHAGVHPGGGRVRDPGTARRPGNPDDRQSAVAGVLQQP
jgi:putrescine transport system permease protein